MSEQNRALPFDVTKGYTSVPNVIFTHYSFYPKFNGTDIRVYAYLLKMHNAEYGYAFPTQIQAQKDLGISDKTFRNSALKLQEMRLIRIAKNQPFNNNVYYFEKPIEDEAEFFATFPEAAEVKSRKTETYEKVSSKKAESKRQLERKGSEEDAPKVDENSGEGDSERLANWW